MVRSQRRTQKKIPSKDPCLDATGDVISAEVPGSQKHQLELGKIFVQISSGLSSSVIRTPSLNLSYIALSDEIPREFSESIISEKRLGALLSMVLRRQVLSSARPIVEKTWRRRSLRFSMRVECRPCEIYRIGKPDLKRSRLVKVALPASSHW
uniref:Uncharacterized protein n=1 Tax=Haemonchus placei TaxID=6290 RepID=A0A0N4WF35_HAEPC